MLMSGKRGLVMGVANDHSIAWGIARTLAAHGAALAFSYQGEALGRRVKPLAESVGASLLLPCDVEQVDSLDAVFAAIAEKWGSLDFVVHANAISAGPIRTLAGAGITDARQMFAFQQRHSPLRRGVTLEEIGGAALYLLSDLSTGVTGDIHFVDSGYNIITMPHPSALKNGDEAEGSGDEC